MKRALYFDLDGTIINLYGQPNWLERLLNEDITVFSNARPLHCTKGINDVMKKFKELGFKIGVISWTPKNVSREYIEEVEKIKLDTIAKYFPTVDTDHIHILDYGTNKNKVVDKSVTKNYLVDDNIEVLDLWKNKNCKGILATDNLIKTLNEFASKV